jgi:hypothetical protein
VLVKTEVVVRLGGDDEFWIWYVLYDVRTYPIHVLQVHVEDDGPTGIHPPTKGRN